MEKKSVSAMALLATLAIGAYATDASAALVIHHDLDSNVTNGGSTGAANNGTLFGDATYVTGKLGNAILLDGTGDFITAGANPVTGASTRTISAWVKTTTTTQATVVGLGINNTAGRKFEFDVDGTNSGRLEVGVNGGRTTGAGASVNDDAWHLATVVVPSGSINISNLLFYVDGVYQYKGSGTTALNTSTEEVIFGRSVNNATTTLFAGLIDDVAIWNEDLSVGEIKGLFDVGNSVELAYDAGDFDALKSVHDAASGSVVIGDLTWSYSTGLSNTAGLTGSGNAFTLVLDGTNGTGLTAVPEPGSLALLGLGGLLIARRRRH